MGVMDKFLNYMKLNDDDEGYYDEDDYMDEEPEPAPLPAKRTSSVMKETPVEEEEKPAKRVASKITQMRTPVSRKVSPTGPSGMEICMIKPSTVEDAREVTETLLSNRTVVLNLEGVDVEIAQRIIDFTSGSCFAIHGNLQKISNYIFIITPESVDVSGDFQSILGAGVFDSPLNADM